MGLCVKHVLPLRSISSVIVTDKIVVYVNVVVAVIAYTVESLHIQSIFHCFQLLFYSNALFISINQLDIMIRILVLFTTTDS